VSDLRQWRERYRLAGLDAIPLEPGTKRALCNRWQELGPEAQWQQAGAAADLNVGIRAGGHLAVIDADTAAAAELLDARLSDMGLVLPKVATPRGGAHFYLQLDDAPDGAYQLLDGAIGPGEFRTGPGAYVVAPASEVGGRAYEWVRGAPEDVPRLAPVAFADCVWLVPGKTDAPRQIALPYELEATARIRFEDVPPKWTRLLAALATAPKGKPIAGYGSRSDAEQAVLLALVVSGRQEGEAHTLFEQYRPGHYAEIGSQAGRRAYLQASYAKACGYFYSDATRRELAALHHAASRRAWPGRTGATDRAVYLATLRWCYQLGRAQADLPTRTIAEIAATDSRTAGAALARLAGAALLTPVRAATCEKATTYRLALPTRLQPTCEVLEPSSADAYAELWTPRRLGKTTGVIFDALTETPQQAAQLAAKTGTPERTTRRLLARLAAVGLAVPWGAYWCKGWRDVGDVAADYDAAGAAFARRQKHKRERAAHKAEHADCGGSCKP